MPVTKELLEGALAQVVKRRDQAIAEVNAIVGEGRMLEAMIAEFDKPAEAAKPKARRK